jgi:hypothetical protein
VIRRPWFITALLGVLAAAVVTSWALSLQACAHEHANEGLAWLIACVGLLACCGALARET